MIPFIITMFLIPALALFFMVQCIKYNFKKGEKLHSTGQNYELERETPKLLTFGIGGALANIAIALCSIWYALTL